MSLTTLALCFNFLASAAINAPIFNFLCSDGWSKSFISLSGASCAHFSRTVFVSVGPARAEEIPIRENIFPAEKRLM
jgi:hypothetical protein